jgi:RNA polymerase sigma factor for flagellar operon FliA
MGIVRYASISLRNIYAKYGDTDDIINEGVIALIDAVERYTPDRSVKFETFATIKVRGAIIDYVRNQDWIPRSVRKFGAELENAYNELYNTTGVRPHNEELAAKMGIPMPKFEKQLAESAGAVTLSFEEILYEDNFDASNLSFEESDKKMYDDELTDMIKKAIGKLKVNEQKVISLYYYERLKFADISKVLKVSESRVCQIHAKAMLHLKRELDCYVRKS